MSGHFLGGDLDADDRDRMAREVQFLTVQAAALMGQLRRLGQPSAESRSRAKLGDLLEGIAATLEGAVSPGRVHLPKGRGLPPVRVDVEALHHVLLGLIAAALAASPEGGSVRVRAALEGRRVRVEITDTGKPVTVPSALGRGAEPTTGRALTFALAAAVLRGMGGRLEGVPRKRGNQLVLWLPAVAS